MSRVSKFEAAKEYDRGVRMAMFLDRPDGFEWEKASPLFMFGYEFGKDAKAKMSEDRNARLRSLGIEEIGIVTIASR